MKQTALVLTPEGQPPRIMVGAEGLATLERIPDYERWPSAPHPEQRHDICRVGTLMEYEMWFLPPGLAPPDRPDDWNPPEPAFPPPNLGGLRVFYRHPSSKWPWPPPT